mmetsp:Transcript_54645/g.63880  ORF Transcript_54645/g.63880 Transcript_54645/m.63880 type:complete len:108 (-) Transcript_54645:2298-2621(-)
MCLGFQYFSEILCSIRMLLLGGSSYGCDDYDNKSATTLSWMMIYYLFQSLFAGFFIIAPGIFSKYVATTIYLFSPCDILTIYTIKIHFHILYYLQPTSHIAGAMRTR